MGRVLWAPFAWIGRENLGTPISNLPHVDLFRDLLAGRDGRASRYADWIRGELARGVPLFCLRDEADLGRWIENRRRLAEGEIDLGPFPVHVRADGLFSLLDGHHRAARALVEGVDGVLVDIVSEDPVWTDLVRALRGIYGGDDLYQEIESPYFRAWRVRRDPARIAALREGLRGLISTGRLEPEGEALDLGSCTGRATRALARLGFDALGIDCDPNVVRIAEGLELGFRTGARYRLGDVAEFLREHPARRFRVVVVLSLFHHFLRARLEDIRSILGDLDDRADVIVLDVPNPTTDAWTRSAIPLEEVGEFYRGLLADREALEFGRFEGRPLLAFVRRPA